ncbi:DUF2069 domain-containing protein [Motiliproteus sp.]|uniref:DUF2069 domain-containing protein n=1 Tax=Motiliproteus sp. TaxID=1898955 RepID=UPI003BAD8840
MPMIKNKLSIEQLQQRVHYSGLATRLSLLGLIGLLSAWMLWISPPALANPITIWLVLTLPLVGFVPAIFGGRARPHIWLCFMILVYFCSGVIHAMTDKFMLLGLAKTMLTVVLFCSAMMYARWKSILQGME